MYRKVNYTIAELQNSTDPELLELIYDKASELYFGTFGESLDKADKAMSDFFAISTVDSEVKNGGFDQFFRNNGLELESYALDGFSRIGAVDFLEITQKAIKIFKNQDSEFKHKRNPDFDPLDNQYYDLESWEKRQIEYIRENYKKFVVE